MMNNGTSFDWRYSVRMGLILGAMVLYTGTIGMIVAFDGREIIAGWLTLGQLLLFAPALAAGYLVARASLKKEGVSRQMVLLGATLAGAVTAVPILTLIFLTTLINVRAMFVNVSTALIGIVTLGQESLLIGGLLLALLMTAASFAGAGVQYVPQHIRRPLTVGLFWTLGVGLLGDLLIQMIRSWFSGNTAAGRAVINTIFSNGALRPLSAVFIFVLAGSISAFWQVRGQAVKERVQALPENKRMRLRYSYWGGGFLLLLALPWIVGTSLSDVATLVGLYILMGLGLNIAVGLAGLLDLGYVTNFAVGAYVAGVLTSTGPLGGAELSFWVVLPISILAAMTTGFIFALPVLRMRGDYLAIATLGFGEIIRLLALSDWLAPLIGGAQGVLFIPKPRIGDLVFQGPQEIYYIVLAGCLLMLFVSQRLNNSRTGRQWMAIREDEDVAAAMGISTIKAKLLAFTLSAASGGLAGAIFAVKLGTIFPHSFNLIISVSVLSLIIVGGMGSVPGVVVGAVALIGLLEVLREFSDFRLLIFGALLIVMMLARPEGLWPSAIRQRELKSDDDDEVIPAQELSVTARG
jgi:branched-chain amino acid transport system permease protein